MRKKKERTLIDTSVDLEEVIKHVGCFEEQKTKNEHVTLTEETNTKQNSNYHQYSCEVAFWT